jgi:hypothetical protein
VSIHIDCQVTVAVVLQVLVVLLLLLMIKMTVFLSWGFEVRFTLDVNDDTSYTSYVLCVRMKKITIIYTYCLLHDYYMFRRCYIAIFRELTPIFF